MLLDTIHLRVADDLVWLVPMAGSEIDKKRGPESAAYEAGWFYSISL
jgi:hypothetical protein